MRTLTLGESKYIKEALRTLYITSGSCSNAHWAAGVMLENDADFVDRLVMTEVSEGLPVDSSLVTLIKGFEQLQRVKNYLYQATYASSGMGSMGWAHWYDDIASAVIILSDAEQALRAQCHAHLAVR